MPENIESDDVERQQRKGSAASWAWRSIAQVVPGLMLQSVQDKSREDRQGYDPRPQEEREQKTVLASVLDRVATVIAKVEAKIDAGPRVNEQTASQTLGITPEAVRQYAPEFGIPYETAKTGEVSFRKNQLRFAAVPAEAERLKVPELPKSKTPAIGQQATQPEPKVTNIGQPSTEPEPKIARLGTLASMPEDATAGMAIRGVENRDSIVHRLSLSAQQVFGQSQSNTNEAETLSPGEAASVPPGAKITVEVNDRDENRSTAGSSRAAGERRTLSRRIVDRLLPVSREERQQRGQPGARTSRAMRYRNAFRGFGIRGKRAARQLSQRLGQTKFARTRLGSALVGAGQRGLQAAGTGLGAVGRTAAVTGTGGALRGMAAAGGPVGMLIAGVTLLAALLPTITTALKSFAQAVNESNRRLGDYNGTIAQAMAQLDVRRIHHQTQLGAATQDSAAELADSIGDMEQALLPLKTDMSNALNWIASKGAGGVETIAEFYKDFKEFRVDVLEAVVQVVDAIPGVDLEDLKKDVKDMRENLNKPEEVETRGREFVKALREIGQHQAAHGVQERDPINPQWEDRGF
jgi:hypothetical protein